jgi:hypothetical protein
MQGGAFERIENHVPVGDNKPNKELYQFQLKKILTETLSDTTIHGIYDIYKIKDYFLKTLIILCFLASAVFCCYLTVTTFISFAEFDVISTTSVISDIPAECNHKTLIDLFEQPS